MKKAFVIAAVIVSLSGCASVGQPIDIDAVTKVEKGVTTQEQLITLIGRPPTGMQLTGDGKRVLTWVHSQAKADAAMFIPIVGPVVGGIDNDVTTFQAVIDEHGVVEDMLYNRSKIDVNK